MNKLLSNCQHGFRQEPSTKDALLLVTNGWHHLLSLNKQVDTIFLYIKNFFNSNLLLSSLQEIGVSGQMFSWLQSYLSAKNQQVVLDGERSAPLCSVTFGVPQGSILGPLLFIIFMISFSEMLPLPHSNSYSMLMTSFSISQSIMRMMLQSSRMMLMLIIS